MSGHHHAGPPCDPPTHHDSCEGRGDFVSCSVVETEPEEICWCEHAGLVAAVEGNSTQREQEKTV